MSERIPRLRLALLGGAAAALVVGTQAAAESPRYVHGTAGSTLGSPDQIARDRVAVRILQSPPVQAATRRLEAFYAKDPTGQYPDATQTLKRAAEATAMGQAAAVVSDDPDRPAAYWAVTAAHAWGAVNVPLSGAMIDNPDNIYRTIPIDGQARYEIRGQVKGQAPAQVTFVLHNMRSGAKKEGQVREHEEELGSIWLDKLPLAADGTFTITIDNTPADGRPNHLQSRPGDRNGYILIRDTLSDWTKQNPLKLEVVRAGGPPVRPPAKEAELAQRAAELTDSTGPYWAAWAKKVMFDRPVNTYTHSLPRVTGWGYIKCGHYRLAQDEALVVRLEQRQAAYLGFQLADVWGQAAPYVWESGSLNQTQARPDPDGAFTYVVSVSDPGVHNWLDPSGLHSGTFCTRWQGLAAGVPLDDAVREIKVVKLKDLKAALPAGTPWTTPAERKAELAARAASYARRLTE
jgi:hypothetical protein